MSEFSEPAVVDAAAVVANYYIHKDGENYGPESEKNLRALCTGGWLQREDLVWQEGAPEWQEAGVVFASEFFEGNLSPATAETTTETEPEWDDFATASAVHLTDERKWPWGAVAIAIAAHAVLLFLVVGILQLYPVNFSGDTTPVSQDPPLEVAMVPEAPPTPPPPDPTPPPPDPTPPTPPPPPPVADLPPPPPAPVEVPVTAPVPAPITPVVPEPVAVAAPALPAPPVMHHKVVRPSVVPPAPVSVPPPPASENTGEPEYLSNPRPEYPITARQRHQQGTVLLMVTLNDAGVPISVSVETSSGYGVLDTAARKKVLAQWRFKPGQGSVVHVPVEFHLDE